MEHFGELAGAIGIGGGLTTTIAWFIFKGFLIDFKKIKEKMPLLATTASVQFIKDNQVDYITKVDFKILEDKIDEMNLELARNIENDKNRELAIQELKDDVKKHQQNHHAALEKTITKMQSEISKLK